MRQIGSLESELHARRLTSFLVTQGIESHCEQDGESWDIWVRDEDHLAEGTSHFERFKKSPDSEEYQGVEQRATELRRADEQRKAQAQKNIVEMRSSWSRISNRKRPLTVTMIALCVMIGMLTQFGGSLDLEQEEAGTVISSLTFMDPQHYFDLTEELRDQKLTQEEYDATLDRPIFRLQDILHGQVWRIVTPSFLHLGLLHIAMNMWMLWILGGLLETRYGTAKLGLLMLALAIPSECIPSLLPLGVGGSLFGLGMSGVIFGLFGFAWMKSAFDPKAGFRIPPSMVIFILAYLFIGISGYVPILRNIGHWAHGVGLVVGMLIGYFPEIVKSFRAR